MSQTHRVRYSLKPSGQRRAAADVLSVDLQTDLEHMPGLLPPAAYVMYIEDLTAGRDVHWTRWPLAYRPGFGG